MSNSALTRLHEQTVLPEWIDNNDHMNVAYYVLIFDNSLDILLDEIGLTRAYRKASNCTVYVLETHVCYLQEVKKGDPLSIFVRVLDCDEKRMHLFFEMRHRDDGFLAATSEQMVMHLDRAGPAPKAAAMPAAMQQALNARKDRFKGVPYPLQAGKVIGIRRKQA